MHKISVLALCKNTLLGLNVNILPRAGENALGKTLFGMLGVLYLMKTVSMWAQTPLLTQQVALCFINTAPIVLLNTAHSEGDVSLQNLPEQRLEAHSHDTINAWEKEEGINYFFLNFSVIWWFWGGDPIVTLRHRFTIWGGWCNLTSLPWLSRTQWI